MTLTEGKLRVHNTPIQIGECELTQQLWGKEFRIAFIEAQNTGEEVARANAQRLAACWNAMSGLTTEQVAGLDVARLVEVLRKLLHHVTAQPEGNLHGMATLETRLQWYEQLSPLREEARAALAGVTKGEEDG